MRRAILAAAFSVVVFACAVPPVLAYDNDYGRDRGRYRNERSRETFGYRTSGAGVIDRTLSDLRLAASRNRVDRHERDHFERAMNELQAFRYRMVEGRFDEGRLNRAIEDLEHLANARQIHPGDRRTLTRDMLELRNFRSARGGYRY
jgi:hypothetical protein